MAGVYSGKLAYTCCFLTSTRPWWNGRVCADGGWERLGKGDSRGCLFSLLDQMEPQIWHRQSQGNEQNHSLKVIIRTAVYKSLCLYFPNKNKKGTPENICVFLWVERQIRALRFTALLILLLLDFSSLLFPRSVCYSSCHSWPNPLQIYMST